MGSSEPARTIFKPQNCLHGVFSGPALSYNELEGVKAEDNLVMRWRRTLICAKRRRDEKKATRPVDRLGGARCEFTERGVAAPGKVGGSFSLIIMGPPADILQVIDLQREACCRSSSEYRGGWWEDCMGRSGSPISTYDRPQREAVLLPTDCTEPGTSRRVIN